jgi:hypothetical protein
MRLCFTESKERRPPHHLTFRLQVTKGLSEAHRKVLESPFPGRPSETLTLDRLTARYFAEWISLPE